MTRDEFAAAALQGLLAADGPAAYSTIIERAYRIADLMVFQQQAGAPKRPQPEYVEVSFGGDAPDDNTAFVVARSRITPAGPAREASCWSDELREALGIPIPDPYNLLEGFIEAVQPWAVGAIIEEIANRRKFEKSKGKP